MRTHGALECHTGTMHRADAAQAADVIGAVLAMIRRGEMTADAATVCRLEGAAATLAALAG